MLRGAKQLLTLRGPSGVRRGPALQDLGIIEDGSVLIRDGIIAAIGSTRRLENLKEARSAIEIPVTGSIVMPAFVDASLNLNLETGNGSGNHPAKRKRLATFDEETLTLMRSCLQHGTLTAEVKAHGAFGDFRSDISVLRHLGEISSQPIAMVRTWRIGQLPSSREELAAGFREALSAVSGRKLARFVELTAPSDASLDHALSSLPDKARLAVKLQWAGGSADDLANVLARVNPPTISCTSNLSEAECALLKRVTGILVFSPSREVLEERNGDAARQLIEAGAGIAIASGYDATHAPGFSMQMAVAFAVLRLRVPVEAAISAATVNAAYAVGCGAAAGTLEFGKRADVLVLNVPDYREIPRRLGINLVGFAIRDGNLVLNRTRWKMGT